MGSPIGTSLTEEIAGLGMAPRRRLIDAFGFGVIVARIGSRCWWQLRRQSGGRIRAKKACFVLSGYADGENEVHFGEKQEAIVVPLRVRSGVNCWPFLERRGKGNEKCTMKWGATTAVIGRV